MDNESKKKERTVFIVRLCLFALFGAVLPIAFIAWRYGLFTQREGNAASITGWGIVSAIILAIVLGYALRQVSKAMPHTMFSQCAVGFMRVILPLFLVYVVLDAIKGNIEYFMQALIAIMACECVAIPANPFPKWRHDMKLDEREKDKEDTFKRLKEWWKNKDKED